MAKIVRLTESDLERIVSKVIKEQVNPRVQSLVNYLKKYSFTPQEIQQAQASLKTPVKPAAPQQQKVAPAKPAPSDNAIAQGTMY